MNKIINKKRIYWNYILGILSITAILIWIAVFYLKDQNLHLYFLNVGQGDSIYVRILNKDLLIDGGPDKASLSELGDIMPFWDKKIDYVILTHPHSDHITGLIDIINRYEVGEIFYTGVLHSSNEYLGFLQIVKNKNIPLKIISKEDFFILDNNVKVNFYWPLEDLVNKEKTNLNDTSIVVKINYNKFSTLLTGDIEKEVQQQLIDKEYQRSKPAISNVNILKIPHHGSANLTDEFLNLTKPDIAVICVGEKNKFNHPAKETLNKLENRKIKTYRTDQKGRIEIITNGEIFWTKTEK